MTTEELQILLRVNGASTYTHSINEVTNVTNNYKNSIGSLTSALAKLVSSALIARFAKQCIDAASDLQEVANVVDVTFGKNAEVVNKWAKNQAANFGLSETSAKRYIGTYGTMAKQFNFTEEQAASMAIELTKLTGDVASFYNLDDKAAMTKMKSVFTGETESLKELGVVMTETQLNAFALSKGIDKPLKQMNEQEKVLLRYQFTMEKLAHAQGDFARTSDGYANTVRSIKLELENLKIEIGTQLMPVAAQGIAIISSGLRTIGPVIISIAQTVRLYGEAWKNASATTKTFAKISFSALAIMVVAPKVIAGVRLAVRLLTTEIVTLGGAMKALLGIAGIIFAGLAIANLTKSVKDLKEEEAAKSIEAIGNSAGVSSDGVEELADSMNDLNDSANSMGLFLASFDEVNKIGDNGTMMSKFVNADDLANILGVADGFGDLNSVLDELNESVDSFESNQLFTKQWWGNCKKFFKGYWDYLKESFRTGRFVDDFTETFDALFAQLGKIHPYFAEFFEGMEELGVKWYGLYNGKIKPIIDEWIEGMEELGEKSYDFFHDNDGDDVPWLTEVYENFNPVAKISGSLGRKLGKGIKGLFSRHAAGGYPNKGSLFLAGEAGPELIGNFGGTQTKVINQTQASSGNSGSILFQPTILIDGRKITATVVDNINTMTRSSGNSPLIQLG